MTTATFARTDQEIQTDVLAELRWDLGTPAKDIGVAVKDGVVTLSAEEGKHPNLKKAAEIARKTGGVKSVVIK